MLSLVTGRDLTRFTNGLNVHGQIALQQWLQESSATMNAYH